MYDLSYLGLAWFDSDPDMNENIFLYIFVFQIREDHYNLQKPESSGTACSGRSDFYNSGFRTEN